MPNATFLGRKCSAVSCHKRKFALWTASGSVYIVKPDEVSTAQIMQRFRDWLDVERIEPMLFKSGVQVDGKIAFEISFRTSEQAARFNRQFG